ncbi:MAG: PDDEXK nuclease domain-containing protein [Bacteroidales bacterium]|nr:PDDEXK nuclease domain-containing protein [Bacteroidales bacterium]
MDRLAKDLQSEFPDMKGFSIRNLKYMKSFAGTYPGFIIVQQPAAQIKSSNETDLKTIKVQQIAAQIPWSYHQVLLDRIKTEEERLFYMIKTIQNAWKRSILTLQIESDLYSRQGSAITNFRETLPLPQADLANETIKNPYLFDFLNLSEEAQEREVEKALIQHIKKFILELGRGFAYVGNQFNLNVAGDDFFLDLLFYNYHLKCFVIFELKVGDFEPEYAGKLNFYINTVNEQIKKDDHNPTIGVLLCRTPNKTVVKYALTGINTPMGVAEYKLSKSLPVNLKGEIPTIKELEAELDKGFEEFSIPKSPLEEKLARFREKIESLKQEPIQEPKTKENVDRVLINDIIPFLKILTNELRKVCDLFIECKFGYIIDSKWVNNSEEAIDYLSTNDKVVTEIRFEVRFSGFKKAGKQAFDSWLTIVILFDRFWYDFQLEMERGKSILRKLYHKSLEIDDIDFLLETFISMITTQIETRLDSLTK